MIAKKFIKRFLPEPKTIQNNKYLKVFGKLLHDPNLWLLNRYSVATACSIGLFITYLPFPGHMIVAALCAILARANLPIALTLVWVVNPLTMIPMFAVAFAMGAMTMGISLQEIDFHSMAIFKEMWQPFLLGCFLCASCLAIISNLVVRILWRYSVAKQWHQRKKRRQLQLDFSEEKPT